MNNIFYFSVLWWLLEGSSMGWVTCHLNFVHRWNFFSLSHVVKDNFIAFRVQTHPQTHPIHRLLLCEEDSLKEATDDPQTQTSLNRLLLLISYRSVVESIFVVVASSKIFRKEALRPMKTDGMYILERDFLMFHEVERNKNLVVDGRKTKKHKRAIGN